MQYFRLPLIFLRGTSTNAIAHPVLPYGRFCIRRTLIEIGDRETREFRAKRQKRDERRRRGRGGKGRGENERASATSDILCRSRDRAFIAPAPRFSILFSSDLEDEHGELLNYRERDDNAASPCLRCEPLQHILAPRSAVLSYNAIYTVVKVRIMSLRFYCLSASSRY